MKKFFGFDRSFHKELPVIEWKPIDGFPGYAVSPEGAIHGPSRTGTKATRLNAQGDLIVDLSRDRRAHTRKVSLLVAKAYLGEQPDHFNSVIHHDGDKTNCHATNLSWRPRWFVVEYNRMFRERAYNVSVVHEPSGEVFGTLREACIKFGLVEWKAYDVIWNSNGQGGQPFPLRYGTLKFL